MVNGAYGTMRGSCHPCPSWYSIMNMWSVKTLPNARVSSAGGCLRLVERVMAISVTAVSRLSGGRSERTRYANGGGRGIGFRRPLRRGPWGQKPRNGHSAGHASGYPLLRRDVVYHAEKAAGRMVFPGQKLTVAVWVDRCAKQGALQHGFLVFRFIRLAAGSRQLPKPEGSHHVDGWLGCEVNDNRAPAIEISRDMPPPGNATQDQCEMRNHRQHPCACDFSLRLPVRCDRPLERGNTPPFRPFEAAVQHVEQRARIGLIPGTVKNMRHE